MLWKNYKLIKNGKYRYALVPEHPHATSHGYVLEHRIVAENKLGRILQPDEVVHHIDGNKLNNNPDNLMVLTAVEHSKLHAKERGRTIVVLKCPICGKIFERGIERTQLSQKRKLNVTCCCARCRGKLTSDIQYHGMSEELKTKIEENVVKVVKRYNT